MSRCAGGALAGRHFAAALRRLRGSSLAFAAALADARLQAALKQYEETWSYYQQARIDSYQVYVWSKLILDCQREIADKPAERVTALENHLRRMKRLEALIKKVRRLGFGRSYDVGASEYYRLEAEFWLTREKPGT